MIKIPRKGSPSCALNNTDLWGTLAEVGHILKATHKQKAPSPELWWRWGTFAATLVNVGEVFVTMTLWIRQSSHQGARMNPAHPGPYLTRVCLTIKEAAPHSTILWVFSVEVNSSEIRTLEGFLFWTLVLQISDHRSQHFHFDSQIRFASDARFSSISSVNACLNQIAHIEFTTPIFGSQGFRLSALSISRTS